MDALCRILLLSSIGLRASSTPIQSSIFGGSLKPCMTIFVNAWVPSALSIQCPWWTQDEQRYVTDSWVGSSSRDLQILFPRVAVTSFPCPPASASISRWWSEQLLASVQMELLSHEEFAWWRLWDVERWLQAAHSFGDDPQVYTSGGSCGTCTTSQATLIGTQPLCRYAIGSLYARQPSTACTCWWSLAARPLGFERQVAAELGDLLVAPRSAWSGHPIQKLDAPFQKRCRATEIASAGCHPCWPGPSQNWTSPQCQILLRPNSVEASALIHLELQDA